MAFRARCCGLILSLIVRLPRKLGADDAVDVPAQQPRQQPDRLLLDLGRQRLKRRTRGGGTKQRELRESRWAHGPAHQHLAANDRALGSWRCEYYGCWV